MHHLRIYQQDQLNVLKKYHFFLLPRKILYFLKNNLFIVFFKQILFFQFENIIINECNFLIYFFPTFSQTGLSERNLFFSPFGVNQ